MRGDGIEPGDEPHEVRPNDHLVEPFFGGLGVPSDQEVGEGVDRGSEAPPVGLRRWLRAIFRRSGKGSD